MTAPGPRRVAVVGGGWAGLAAAVAATQAGCQVTLYEMAPQLGGRARSTVDHGLALDNGQHILIGAYRDTLALMRTVGVDVEAALLRTPLALVDAQGVGLTLPSGSPVLSFMRGVMRARQWSVQQRLSLLATAVGWRAAGFTCDVAATVDDISRRVPIPIRQTLIDPLCVAALNTPASQASGQVFLRILRDALFGGRGACDLLLPRVSLTRLLPEPAANWLQRAGATVHLRMRVDKLESDPHRPGGWRIDGQNFDAVVLACSTVEAARLAKPHHHAWSVQAAAIQYQAIVTVYARAAEARLDQTMTALREGPCDPAQFVFDHGRLSGQPGLLAFVVSGANQWLAEGLQATVDATLAQARRTWPMPWATRLQTVHAVAERRATFACVPGLCRPAASIAVNLVACGDYIEGPYPSTLEGAVRSGLAAAAQLAQGPRH